MLFAAGVVAVEVVLAFSSSFTGDEAAAAALAVDEGTEDVEEVADGRTWLFFDDADATAVDFLLLLLLLALLRPLREALLRPLPRPPVAGVGVEWIIVGV